ncbi:MULTISPECIES: efflux RND transporter periplasmic adaptor subunit [Flavobacterium]|uniref:Cobalt-zinc-cadmium resistance protein CzcB n=2 Tax=Flavobacterium TaxID=237 RepID=A0A437UBY0_9FLAO|nr:MULTISPECIES: efflux RND transporter periplasmic adaptor subunit [Flavobacterium]OWP83800.1 efflux transporter periplasmic adaptor subunit [Flavobacterium davisii]QYS89988.1 efflux RND transporter periplasmic adaptor subunit [Flavobacterium davisii]RVU91117.1 efflux RND transporter periplasmic adaptor subunit [Flavobacterium columnare]SPE77200.1 Cobalt-zinc-cadmium resistance protein CzcB [Flavobacterium columnare]
MKKIFILTLNTLLLVSCGSKEKSITIDALIESKNLIEIKNKRASLQSDLAKLDEALATLEKKEDEALVQTITVKDTVFNHYVEIQGNVDTQKNVLIQPEMPGTLVNLNIKAGQSVAKGQILGRVDDAGMSQQLANVQTQYELAKTTYERQKRLWDQKIGSEIQYLQAQTQMISLSKSINQIKAQIAKTIIRAPFNGVIDEVFVERGQVVSATPQGLMRIVNLSQMYVRTEVPEMYLPRVKKGTSVIVNIASINKNSVGKVCQVAKTINPANRSFTVKIDVSNPDELLRPNQVAKLKIMDYSNPSVISIPTNIIQKDGKGNNYVYKVINGKKGEKVAEKIIVKIGQTANNYTEILSGLNQKDVVVSEGANMISEGMKLTF